MSKHQDQSDAVKEFLARGGEIQEIPRGKSGYAEGQTRSAWGAPRKKKADVAPKPHKHK